MAPDPLAVLGQILSGDVAYANANAREQIAVALELLADRRAEALARVFRATTRDEKTYSAGLHAAYDVAYYELNKIMNQVMLGATFGGASIGGVVIGRDPARVPHGWDTTS